MSKVKAFLFDMDGVVTDTEEQYDEFLGKMQQEYNLVSDFVQKVKGTTLTDIINNFFSHLSEEGKKEVVDKVLKFELNEMKYHTIPGILDFLQTVKKQGYKIALVTSSMKVKVEVALKSLKLESVFDAVVTADDVILGKPNPQCYLKGAEKLGLNPQECLVLEDSFAGIEAGTKAGMKVIGLSTTNSEESLQGKVSKIIPNFEKVKVEELL